MTLMSVVSIVPADKQSKEHSVKLSADGLEPATHYAYHGWEPDRAQKVDETGLSKRVDVFTKEVRDKQSVAEAEKTGFNNFAQTIALAGLVEIVPAGLGSKQVDPKSGEVTKERSA